MAKFLGVILLLILHIKPTLYSQNISGKVVNSDMTPIYGSTIFIKETKQGLACNDNGEFLINLEKGNYTIEYRCLGYESEMKNVTIDNDTIKQIVILRKKHFDLDEIVISNNEDPAYEIIRKAIEKAPFHLNKVKSYKSEAYIKGNMEVTKVSKLVNTLSSAEGMKLSDFKEKLFLQESFNEIEFDAPDTYKQTVKAFSSTIPDNLDPKDAMSIVQSSLYSPTTSGRKISPLNPKAFSYYKFRYEGFYEENGQTINKIKIIPKLNDPDLMSGYIYIAENYWDIRHAELVGNAYGFKQNYTITYSEVSPSIYLPTTYSNNIEGGFLGTKGYFTYYASIRYKEITLDETLKIEKTIINKKNRKSLEIKSEKDKLIKTDSLATKKDSDFWKEIRNIPLIDKEIESYRTKDSIQQFVDSVRKEHHNSKFKPMDLFWGGKLGGDSAKVHFKYEGLLGAAPEYNFVDGLWIGQKLSLSKKWNNHNNQLSIVPEAHYTTSRKRVVWKTNIVLEYAPMNLGKLSISGGNITEDYNPEGITRFDNAISSLFWKDNVSMLYQKKYLRIQNDIDITNGLRITGQVQIASRHGLHNTTEYSFFNKNKALRPNWDMPYNFDLSMYEIGVSYTPRYYYSRKKGKKVYQYANSPTLRAKYTEAFSGWQTNNSRFRKIESGIYQKINTDHFSYFSYDLSGGAFLGKTDRTNITDFKHFHTANMFTITTRPFEAFMLLDNYAASTNEYWAESHLNYYSKYIFLKRLPFLQGKIFKECLHFKYLYTPNIKNYNELGYSIDLSPIFTLGVHTSFQNMKYQSFGVRLSYSILDIIKMN